MTDIPAPDQPWSLAGKTALVTGASRGIGGAIAIHLARKGLSRLAITSVNNHSSAESTPNECRKLGVKETIALQADLLNPSIGSDLVQQVLGSLDTSTVDIIVNNAVLADPSTVQPFLGTTLDIFSKTMQSNVYACGLDHCNTAKTSAHDPIMMYSASKAALESLTRSFAGRFAAEKGATFNSVGTGSTITESVAGCLNQLPEESARQFYDFTGATRAGTPDDIAYIVSFLASEEGRWVNGACVSANGGSRLTLAAFG